jgi:O-antigen ligase
MLISINSSGTLEFRGRPIISTFWILVLIGIFLGVISGYLIVRGDWYLAVGFIVAVPVLIALFWYPLLGVFLWLGIAQFLMVTQTTEIRMIYWAIHRGIPLLSLGLLLVKQIFMPGEKRLPKLGWSELAMMGYLIATFVSIIFSQDDPVPVVILLFDRMFIGMCLYMLVYLSRPREKDLQILIYVVLFITAAQSLIGILSWIAPGLLPDIWLRWVGLRTIGSLSNPSVYTAALLFGGLILFQAGMYQKKKRFKVLYIATFIVAGFCVFLSLSRASWLGGLLVGIGLMILYPRFMLKFGLIVIVLAILAVSFLLLGESTLIQDRFYSEESESSALSRLPVTIASLRMFSSKPIFGWGYGNFDLFDRQFYNNSIGSFTADNKDHASHNFFLTILAEQGLVGFFLYMAPVIILLFRSIKNYSKLSEQGFLGKNFIVILWLIMVNLVVLNNFVNLTVVYGVGLWWITLGLISSVLNSNQFNWKLHRIDA